MIRKVYDVVVRTAIAVLLVLGLWLVINGAYKKDIGNLSDWISASCNIAMAGAAVFAALEAKKWFHQKTRLNNLDAAHKLALEFENSLWEINTRLFTDTIIRARILNFIENEEKSIEEVKSIVLLEFDKNTSSDLDQLAYIYTCQCRLERFNVYPSIHLISLLEEIKNGRDAYLNAHYSYLAELVEYYINKDQMTAPSKSTLEKANKELGAIFEQKLAKREIGRDYFFNMK
jgi:hypothetical protein